MVYKEKSFAEDAKKGIPLTQDKRVQRSKDKTSPKHTINHSDEEEKE